MTLRRAAAAAAGPLLIVAAVLLVLRDFAFAGKIGIQHVDPLAYWMPTHCTMGEMLRDGVLPGWNPYAIAGAPFAADPQSGWMYLPVMALYSLLPCASALTLFVVLQPVIAGLGLWWFLRIEGLSRAAATVGGLSLALGIASSRVAVTVPFSGALAWTIITLACAARLVRSPTMAGRLAWTAALAVAWGQIAGAHMTHGLVLGTLALVAYLIVALRRDVRGGMRTRRQAAALVALIALALPVVNAAVLLPRVAYAPRTSVAMGYRGMDLAAAQLAGIPHEDVLPGASSAPPWAFAFASSPGAYLGAAPLLLSVAALRARRRRALAVGFAVLAAGSYVLSLRGVAQVVENALGRLPLVDIYLHEPNRFRYGVLLCLPILAAIGLDAWREERGRRDRAGVLAPGVALWFAFPLAIGVALPRLALPLAAMTVTIPVLTLTLRRPALIAAVPALLAVDLGLNAFLGQGLHSEYVMTGTVPAVTQGPFTPLLRPRIYASDFLKGGPIERALAAEDGRFLGWSPSLIGQRGYLEDQAPPYWSLLVNQRGMLFGLEDVQGYNPAQLETMWTYLRAVDPKDIKYNAAVYVDPPEHALDLLDVGAYVAATGHGESEGETRIATDGRWTAFRRADPPRRVSVHTAWDVVRHDDALAAVTAPAFDPARRLILEQDPGIEENGRGPATASYEQTSPSSATVTVRSNASAVVLIRNVHDVHWHASIDGRPAELLRADFLMQAVAVPAGEHTIELRYSDPWIGRGGLISALALLGLGLGAAISRRRAPGRQGADRR